MKIATCVIASWSTERMEWIEGTLVTSRRLFPSSGCCRTNFRSTIEMTLHLSDMKQVFL